MSLKIVCGKLLLNAGAIVDNEDEFCCPYGCHYADINPAILSENPSYPYGTYVPSFIEDATLYDVDIAITRTVDPCVDSNFGTLTPNPSLSYHNGQTNGGDYDVEFTDGTNSWRERYTLTCGQEAQTIAGAPDPIQVWELHGYWYLNGDVTECGLLIDELGNAFDGSGAITGSLTIHSYNPFHATATFTPVDPYPICGPTHGGDAACGPVTVEFTE